MPGSTPNPSSELVLRQLRHVRRRWNARELTRAALLAAGAAGVAAAAVVVAALAASRGGFVTALVFATAALVAGLAATGVAAARRWVGARAAHQRVDRLGGLGGRLAALLDVPATAPSGLQALLAAQNEGMLPLWAPRRLVPRLAPRGAALSALAGAAALLVAVGLGPVAAPPPEPAAADLRRPPPGERVRLVAEETAGEAGGPGDVEEGAGEDGSSLARAAERLRHRLRRQLWGEAEALRARAAEAAAREPAAGTPRAARARDTGRGGHAGRVEAGAERAGAAPDGAADAADASGHGTRPDRDARADAASAASGGTADGPAGAGTGTSPDLYGAPMPVARHDGTAPFALGLAADVRTVRTGPRPPSGEAPRRDPDAAPALAASAEDTVTEPRPPVPPEWAPVVRVLYERAP